MKNKKTEIDQYYENVDASSSGQLQNLRHLIKEELPDSEEIISYQIPTFRYNGKNIIAIGGFKDHVSLFPLGSSIIKIFSSELKEFKTSKGTIQFSLTSKIPKFLIKKIIEEKLRLLDLE